jgi:hypothetical protein
MQNEKFNISLKGLWKNHTALASIILSLISFFTIILVSYAADSMILLYILIGLPIILAVISIVTSIRNLIKKISTMQSILLIIFSSLYIFIVLTIVAFTLLIYIYGF